MRKRGSLATSTSGSSGLPSARVSRVESGGIDAASGDVVDRDLLQIGLGDAVIGPAETERVEELLAQDRADVLARDRVDDLSQDEPARDRVVGEHPPGLRERLRLAEDVAQVVAVADVVEAERLARQVRHAAAVGEDLADRDFALPVLLVAGDVLRDRVLQRDLPAFAELVDEEGGDPLRGRVHAERRLRSRRDLLGIGVVARSVAPRVPDRPIDDHGAPAAHAYLDRRMDATAIPAGDRVPDRVDVLLLDPAGLGRFLLADSGRGLEVVGDANSPERIGDQGQARDRRHRPASLCEGRGRRAAQVRPRSRRSGTVLCSCASVRLRPASLAE